RCKRSGFILKLIMTAIAALLVCLLSAEIMFAQEPGLPAVRHPAPCIEWSIDAHQNVNKPQAERLYGEACRWVKENITTAKPAKSPCIKIIVGEPCPGKNNSGPCANPLSGEIYIPVWTRVSSGNVVQGTIATMLAHLLDAKDITEIAQRLLNEDETAFLD